MKKNNKKVVMKLIVFGFVLYIFSAMVDGLLITLFDTTIAEYFAENLFSLIN
ncbi:hypothetical protein [Facklamia miroungae]|uniref:Uncharacterized protein n=1 Tax=Facklamia miroungae TaxID=120956 RepID=A0A1G7NVK1_9LACT|nr:hypothetical protein [Facklamia miroungae]NKZ28481.1 hypothetical protein [Facklamia miroungae]SDF78044.1 hypothetical protein SAMN05421791_10120 [Facklamia miroungae]